MLAKHILKTAHKYNYGPGGCKCPCCSPLADVRKLNRFFRRKLKWQLKVELSTLEIE